MARSEQAEQCDAYAMRPEAVEEPPRRLSDALRQIGPGLILAAAVVGTGELIATTQLGAKAGFSLLWLVIVSCFVKVFAQAELGRFTLSTGQTTFAAFRALPGPAKWIGAWWILMMLSTQLQLGAVVGGIGQALHVAMPGISPALAGLVGKIQPAWGQYLASHPALAWGALCAVGTSLILALGGYGAVERISTILVAGFTFVTVLCVVLLPAAGHPIPWGEVARGFTFSLPRSPEALAAALAVIGITGVGATELVTYPYWCVEKGYARKTGPPDGSPQWLARARGWMRVMMLDAWVSMAIYTLATVAFFFLGAAVLHGGGASGLPTTVAGMLDTLAQMYAPVMGPKLATWFIVIGVFTVLYSTLYAATGANARTLADFVHTYGLKTYRNGRQRMGVVTALCVAFPIIDLLLFAAVGNPVKMVLIGGIAQAATLPMLAGVAIYLRYRRIDRALAPGRAWDALLWLSLLFLCVAATYGVWDTLAKVR